MKKIIMVVVMVALFAGAVGVGVHVLNKEARADVTYSVDIHGWIPGEQWVDLGLVEGCTVKFKFDFGDWELAEEIAEGTYAITRENACQSSWKVLIVDPEMEWYLTPDENPCSHDATILSFVWHVAP